MAETEPSGAPESDDDLGSKEERTDLDDPFGILADDVDSAQALELALEGLGPSSRSSPALAADESGTLCDDCPGCGARMRVFGSSYVCTECGEVIETESDIYAELGPGERSAPRLRIVGPGKDYYQRDLDRSAVGVYSEQQLRTVRDEYDQHNRLYCAAGGNSFPDSVLDEAAGIYNAFQREGYVKRSQCKRSIMAACLHRACISKGFVREPRETAAFMRLNHGGIARGSDFLRRVDENHSLGLDMNKDQIQPYITTVFAQLDLQNDQYNDHRAAVEEIVRRAIDRHIGTSSQRKSKVISAAYVVLVRAKMTITLEDVRTKCQIRRTTVTKFVNELELYHGHFIDIYQKYSLCDQRKLHGA